MIALDWLIFWALGVGVAKLFNLTLFKLKPVSNRAAWGLTILMLFASLLTISALNVIVFSTFKMSPSAASAFAISFHMFLNPKGFKKAPPLLIAAFIMAFVGAIGYALVSKPDAPAVTFVTLDGRPIQLDSLRGKIVLVNFWATTCPGCTKEMPDLIETYKQYKDKGFEVIAVAMPYDPPSYVVNFTQTRHLPFPVVLDVKGEYVKAFGDVQLTPTSFIIGKKGQILEQKLGELDFVKLRALLDKELK